MTIVAGRCDAVIDEINQKDEEDNDDNSCDE
jgi:hypothetical protein